MANPAHQAGNKGYGRHKTPEPHDAEYVYSKAIWDGRSDESNAAKKTFWAMNDRNQLYRFFATSDGTNAAHFSGLYDENASSMEKQQNHFIEPRDIPITIKRAFKITK